MISEQCFINKLLFNLVEFALCVKENKIVILNFCILFLFSFKSDKELKSINIIKTEEADLFLSEIGNDIKYLPLGNDIPISEIAQVKYFGGQYFITDKNERFLRFDESGKLLNQIGKIGRGPGEYQSIRDFVVHQQTKNIYCINGRKPDHIIVYSLEGKYLHSIDLTSFVKYIGITNQNLFIYYFDARQNIKTNIEIRDKEGNLIDNHSSKYSFTRDRVYNDWSECILYSLGGTLHFKEIHSDTIFYLDGLKIVPKMILNSGDRLFTVEKREKINNDFLQNPTKIGETMVRTLRPVNLFETIKYVFYFYRYDRKGRMLIYNKSTNNQIEIDSDTGIKNDIDGGPNIDLKMTKDDNTVLSWINAYELKQHIESKDFKNSTPKYPEKKKELEQLANSLDENDNTVLMLVKLKE
jgi:hypothetical protein